MRGARFVVFLIVGVGVLGVARRAQATVAATPGSIDFMEQVMNVQSAPIALTLTNDDMAGPVMVTLTQSAGCGSALAFAPASVSIPARSMGNDGMATVNVRFTPNSRTPLTGCTITVTGGPNTPTVSVAGDSDAPQISVPGIATDLQFGSLRWNPAAGGAVATRTVTIDNTGDAAMAITDVTSAFGGTHSADFRVLAGMETGFPIAPAGSGTITVEFDPRANGGRTASLDLELTNDPTGESYPNVPATGTGTQSNLTFNRTSPYNLGSAPTGGGTVDGSVTFRNLSPTASTTLNISSATLTGDFVFRDHTCLGLQTCTPPSPNTIAVDGTDPYAIRCTPSAAGLRTGTLTVISDDASSGNATSTRTLNLECTGVPPTLGVSPASVTFAGNTRVGAAAPIQVITISNAAGAQTLTYTAATSSAVEFPLSCMGGGTACLMGSVPAGGSAQIQVGFVAGGVGPRMGMVTLTTNDPDPTDMTKVIPLSGTGAISTLSGAASIAFGTVDINQAGGVTQNYTITNTGGISLNITSMVIMGDPSGNFSFAFAGCTSGQSCGPQAPINPSPPGPTATITLRCDPTTTGAKSGMLHIFSDDPASPEIINLSCTGATPELMIGGTPVADFGNQRINVTSLTTRTFTITNLAGATTSNLTYAVTEASPHFSIACSAPGCSGTLTAGAPAVTVTISFRPTVATMVTGNINVATNDVSTPSVDIPVSGTGVEPLVALTMPTPAMPPTVGGTLSFTDTAVGQTSGTQMITVQNTGSMTLTISSVTNSNAADFNLTGATGTSTIAPGASQSWMVACAPDTPGTRTGTIAIANDSNNDTSVDVALTCSSIQGNIVVTSATPFQYNQPGNVIDFGTVFLNQARMTTVTITNNGNRAVTIMAPTVTAGQGFTLGAPSAMVVMPNNGTITLPITFMPTLATQGMGTVTIQSDWNTLSFNVVGDGEDSGVIIVRKTGPTCEANGITGHDYGQVQWDQTRAQVFCVRNIAEAAAQITGITLMGDTGGNYALTPPGALPTLQRNDTFEFTVTANPNDAMLGTFTATIQITTPLPAPDNLRSLALTYQSTGPTMVLNPGTTLNFGGVDVDLAGGMTMPVTLTNMMPAGMAPLVISGITSPTGSFSLMGAMPGSIAAGASTTIMVRFDPSVERSSTTMESSTFTVNTTGYYVGGVRQPAGVTVTLSGYGIDQHIQVDPAAVDFGMVYRNPRMDDPRAQRTVQVCNTGEAPLAVSMITGADSPFSVIGATTFNVAGIAAPGGTRVCQMVTVEFRPADEAYQVYPPDQLSVMNDDNGAMMAPVMLTGTSIPRPVTVTSAVTATQDLAVGVPVRLRDIFPAGVTAENIANPAEGFTITLDPVVDAAMADVAVVGDVMRDLSMGETEVYDVTITANRPGPLTFTLDVHLDGDPFAHQNVPVTLNAVEVSVRGGGGCSTGGGVGGGALAAVVAALALAVRRRRAAAVAAMMVAGAVAASPAQAQGSRDLELSTFSPAPATEGAMFAVESPTVGTKGAWAIDLAFNHALSPMTITNSTMDGADIVSARTAVELGVAYAVLPKLELGLRVPLLRQTGADPGIAGLDFSDAGGTTIGDVGVLARYALVDGKAKLGASATITAPTAKADQFAGSGTVTGAARLLASVAAGRRVTLAANGGFLVRGGATEFAGMTQGHQVLFGAGASLRAAEKLWVIGETFGHFGLGSDDAVAASPIEATLGIRYRLGDSLAVSLGGGTGVRAGIGAPKARGFLMLSFSPRARKDEPLHIYIPPPPRDVGDDDKDGVVNADDACPQDAEDSDGFEDDDGCPDADNDKDGLLDGNDKCPGEPEDKDGVDDGDGCVDGDNDGDGVLDLDDKCPAEPEDKDGFDDGDGCEEPDNDNDGVPDVLDQCALEAETINGNADEDGCPDKGDSLIMVLPDRIEVLEPVTFQGQTAKLGKTAAKALSQIGATMRADRKIKRLRITVHVHPRTGGDEALSQKRADEIRDWLVNWGVEPERLEARGVGSKRPLVPKNQKGAEQINDRVEFIIFERQ